MILCIPDALAGTRDSNGNLVRKYNNNTVPEYLLEMWNELITTMLDIFVGSRRARDNNLKKRIVIPLNEEALDRWAEFHDKIEGEMGEMGNLEKNLAARYPSKGLRIALMRVGIRAVIKKLSQLGSEKFQHFSLPNSLPPGTKIFVSSTDDVDLPIPVAADLEYGKAIPADIEAGIRFVEYFRHHDQRFLGCIKNLLSPLAERLLRHIKDKNLEEFSKREAQRLLGKAVIREVESAIGELISMGYIRLKRTSPVPGQKTRGQPSSPVYEVHPEFHR